MSDIKARMHYIRFPRRITAIPFGVEKLEW